MGNGSKELREVEDFCPSSQSEKLEKKIICTKKVYKIDHNEFACEFLQFLSSALIK